MPAVFAHIDVTPGGGTGSFTDVDVSAYIPAGSVGVILHVDNPGNYGVRKNGSTDNRAAVGTSSNCWVFVGVDSSLIFEINRAGGNVYLLGYFAADEAAFFTNATDKSTGTTGSWVDVDISADTGADTALLALIETYNTNGASGNSCGYRKNGSTDNRTTLDGTNDDHAWCFAGCDGSEIFEQQISSTNIDTYLTGYMTARVTSNTNGTDRTSGGTNGVYNDLTALPAGAIAGLYEGSTAITRSIAYRENGAPEDLYGSHRGIFAIVKCDASRIIEAKVSGAASTFELGYLTAIPPPNFDDVIGQFLQPEPPDYESDISSQMQGFSMLFEDAPAAFDMALLDEQLPIPPDEILDFETLFYGDSGMAVFDDPPPFTDISFLLPPEFFADAGQEDDYYYWFGSEDGGTMMSGNDKPDQRLFMCNLGSFLNRR